MFKVLVFLLTRFNRFATLILVEFVDIGSVISLGIAPIAASDSTLFMLSIAGVFALCIFA